MLPLSTFRLLGPIPNPPGTGSFCGVFGAKCACPLLRARFWDRRLVWRLLVALSLSAASAVASESQAINPFGPVKQDRDDAVPGYLELSDGSIHVGNIYMTRDKRLKLYDESLQRQREIPLRVVREIECTVQKEWMEKEWKFKELALDEKMVTGRVYPSREYVHTVTLQDGRTISGPLAEIIYVQPFTQSPAGPTAYRPDVQPQRFFLHKRDKGEIGTTLKSLKYVKRIKLGEEAVEEGKKKAARYRPKPEPEDAQSRGSRVQSQTRPLNPEP